MINEDITQNEIIISNEKNSFTICYGGSDLYWLMDDYNENNLFVINKDNKIMYSLLKKVFTQIKKYDYPHNKTLNNNVFGWTSEAEGLPENAHVLTIKKTDDSFYIKFHRNPANLSPQNTCYICFCLSGSKNQNIANAFNEMFTQYKVTNTKSLKRTKKNRC